MARRLSYSAELAGLDTYYEQVLAWDAADARRAILSVAGMPAVFVGTGGTMAAARLAAQLHERMGGQLARVMTPLEFARLSETARCGVVLFSAGLKHPDALITLERLTTSRYRPAVAVTLRDPAELDDMTEDVSLVGLPSLSFKEGFLATTSVISMMACLIKVYLGDDALPQDLPWPQVDTQFEAERLMILTTPDLAAVGTDLETRLNELGLAAVQVADYRNFAHGRHVGLARNSQQTTVIGLSAPPLDGLADATMNAFPETIRSVRWPSKHEWPINNIELTLASMQLVAFMSETAGVEASRPGAPEFGRRLYHLGIRRLVPPAQDGPIDRKLAALAAGSSEKAREMYRSAYSAWLADLGSRTFKGLVLDYDGTICSNNRRTELPAPEIQNELLRLLGGGVHVGVASGRGKSLHRDMRAWVPKALWGRLVLGLYNGGVLLRLDEDLPIGLANPNEVMLEVESRIRQLPLSDVISVEARSVQVTVIINPDASARPGKLAELIADAMNTESTLPVGVVSSGHSIDVVPLDSSKRSVIERLDPSGRVDVLVVGDRGDHGGNDFELLSAVPWSLTVDRCSADPTRCWFLGYDGSSGPNLLARYFQAFTVADGGFVVKWPAR